MGYEQDSKNTFPQLETTKSILLHKKSFKNEKLRKKVMKKVFDEGLHKSHSDENSQESPTLTKRFVSY